MGRRAVLAMAAWTSVMMAACTAPGAELSEGDDEQRAPEAARGCAHEGVKLVASFGGVQDDARGIPAADGSVEAVLSNGTLFVHARVRGLAPGTEHAMFIHDGPACMGAAVEPNGDGYLDPMEARLFVGRARIPLDDDLADLGAQRFPYADARGTLVYEAAAPVEAFVRGLRLSGPEALCLEHKIVQIFGAPPETELPPTVEDFGAPPWEMLPIGCGAFVLVR